jgi:aminopeptidase N
VDTSVTDLFKLLNRNNYEKGAWVLHMLRHLMGDKKFFEGVRDYYQTYRDRNADSGDLQRLMEKHYGRRLDWFFGEWLYKPGFPAYRVRWAWVDHLKQTCVRVDQAQPDTVFRTPLDIEFRTGGEVRRETVNPQRREQVFCFRQSGKPQSVSVDPDDWVLKTLTLSEEK